MKHCFLPRNPRDYRAIFLSQTFCFLAQLHRAPVAVEILPNCAMALSFSSSSKAQGCETLGGCSGVGAPRTGQGHRDGGTRPASMIPQSLLASNSRNWSP